MLRFFFYYSFFFPFNTGRAQWTLKNSINGPMKNAVIIVPTPAIVIIALTATSKYA